MGQYGFGLVLNCHERDFDGSFYALIVDYVDADRRDAESTREVRRMVYLLHLRRASSMRISGKGEKVVRTIVD